MLQKKSYKDYTFSDSYEKFMTKHLQHYGFYTEKNRFIFQEFGDYDNFGGFSASDDSQTDVQEEPVCVKILDQIKIPNTTQLVYNVFDDGKVVPKLKAPHLLYYDFKFDLKQAPRWPVEMQVIPERVTHIWSMPQQKEPLYIQDGSESTPDSRGEDTDSLIYDNSSAMGPFFIKSKSGHSTEYTTNKPVTVELESENDETLLFESRFESGNLEKVYKVGLFEYELHLRTDMYTTKHTQWYYFRITNTMANRVYRFTIVNLCKADSLYNDGLRPLMYSEKDVQQSNKGWRRWGSNIIYYRNNRRYETTKGNKSYYSLTWTCSLPHDKDTVYFSHCYPYTYTDLMQYLDRVKNDSSKTDFCRIKLLTHSMADNLSILMTITNQFSDAVLEKRKKVIVITGRVHPGESNASWMMEGVLDYLLDNTPDAKLLRDLFIFKIVPMINPDGVIVGNYRCSLAGRDLNRNYRTKLKSSYPIIASIKTLIEKIIKEREVLFYCDFHGHSKKHNIFIYGCNDHSDEKDLFLERVFPVLLNRNNPDKFDYRSCKFKMQKSKAGTGRIVFRNLGVTHSFTIEASFCGSTLGSKKKDNDNRSFHFNIDDLKSMGKAFCNSLLDFCDPDQKQVDDIIVNIREDLSRKYLSKIQNAGETVDITKMSMANISSFDLSDDESSDDDNGSDSSNSDGLPADYEYMDRQIRNHKMLNSKSKRDERQEIAKGKPTELLKTCMHMTMNNQISNNKVTNTSPDKPKLTPINSKAERKKRLVKDNVWFMKKIQPVDMVKKDSPFFETKRSVHEFETNKILLSYPGKSNYREHSIVEPLCNPQNELFIKESEPSLQRSVINPWEPLANVPDNSNYQQSVKFNTSLPLKSGPKSKKVIKLQFTPHFDGESTIKTDGVFIQRPLNPIKRVPQVATMKRQ